MAGSSCDSPEQTAVMVEIDSDIPLDRMDRLRLRIDSVDDGNVRTTRLDSEYVLAERAPGDPGGSIVGSSKVRLPIRIAVLPRASTQAVIHVTASGLAPGSREPSVSASALVAFVPGRSLLMRVGLHQVCVDVHCAEGQTCVEISDVPICVDEEVERPACELPDLEAGRIEGCDVGCATAADCDDGTGCTTDVCQDGSCEHAAACGGATPLCCDGACAGCCDDGDCDDGDECTDDLCAGGDCTYPDHVCPDDGSPCTAELCADGACQSVPVCAEGELCCDGTCGAQCCIDADCPPEELCATFPCVEGQCVKLFKPEGTPCGEGGVCNGPPEECVLPCAVDADCPDEIDCATFPCVDGECTKLYKPEGTPCGDGGVCNGPAEECVECLVTEDCGTDPCGTATCTPEQTCAWECLPDDTPCGGGLTCLGCVCQA